MNAKTKQPRGNETQGRRVVVGRIVFSFNAQVLKVIDLEETDMKSDKKIEIVKNELGKLRRCLCYNCGDGERSAEKKDTF